MNWSCTPLKQLVRLYIVPPLTVLQSFAIHMAPNWWVCMCYSELIEILKDSLCIYFAPKPFLFYELRTEAADWVNLKTRSCYIHRDLLPGGELGLKQDVCVYLTLKYGSFVVCFYFPSKIISLNLLGKHWQSSSTEQGFFQASRKPKSLTLCWWHTCGKIVIWSSSKFEVKAAQLGFWKYFFLYLRMRKMSSK